MLIQHLLLCAIPKLALLAGQKVSQRLCGRGQHDTVRSHLVSKLPEHTPAA